jgi:predicted aconitase
MKLTNEEEAMLAGAEGRGVQKAMEIVTALGKIYEARDLVPVSSVQVAGVSYKNLGEAGLEFLREWAAQGARVRVPTTLNPAGLDLERWQELGFAADFAHKQDQVLQAFAAMGIQTTCTCTPYFVGNVPRRGEHIAWAESSAVSFANSVLGARTNREGGPGALAAAITGRTARFGLHLERRATLVVEVRCPVVSAADFGALGILVGQQARNGIPYFRHDHIHLPAGHEQQNTDRLKMLGAAMAASGAVALYHIEGVTPESGEPGIIASDARTIIIERLDEGYKILNSSNSSDSSGSDESNEDESNEIDLVWIGCPHCSIDELAQVVSLLNGRPVRAALWVTMARAVRNEAARQGLVAVLEQAGGRVVADTCLVVAPVKSLGFRRMATVSGKGAYYVPAHSGLAVRYGPLEACIEAAVTGYWPEDLPWANMV